jgi:hypothetical protein
MLAAHARTRKDGAVGVDGQTAEEYEVNLEANLQNLLDRAKSGTYVAPPVRRVHIPKAGSPNETRPLGIPTYEDKILQRAVLAFPCSSTTLPLTFTSSVRAPAANATSTKMAATPIRLMIPPSRGVDAQTGLRHPSDSEG